MLNFHLELSGAQRTELDGELVKARQAGDLPRANRVLSILTLAEVAAFWSSRSRKCLLYYLVKQSR